MLPGRPPQVTFSCDTRDETCDFQFWVAQVESFYCHLDACESSTKVDYDTNTTTYGCDKIKCSCVPGRFLCGEDGSIGTQSFIKNFAFPDCYLYRPGRFPAKRDKRSSFIHLQERWRMPIRRTSYGHPYNAGLWRWFHHARVWGWRMFTL